MRRRPVLMAISTLPFAATGSRGIKRARAATGRATGIKPGAAQIVFQPSPDSPLVALRIFFQVGSADDPPGKEGLAALTAAMLGEGGTHAHAWSEVLELLYPMAASINSYGDRDSMVFEGMVHGDNLDRYADLLAAQILTPRFDPADFSRHRQDAIDHLTNTLRGNDDEALGKEALQTLLYPGHPYGRPAAGTVKGLNAITLDDCKKFYASAFTRDRLILGVSGGATAKFAAAFSARFDALPARGTARATLPAAPSRQGPQVVVIEKDCRANAISLGHPLSVTRSDPDFFPLAVAASYLGEHRTFNGVLMNVMREQRGLNYGDYAYVENFIQDGWTTFPLPNVPRRQQHFELWIRPVAPANTLFAIRHAIYETDRLIRDGIPEAGFQQTRDFLAHYCNLWAQDASRRLGHAIDGKVYGKDLIAELQARLPRMKKLDVDRAVRKHLSTRNLAIAIVGNNGKQLLDRLLAGTATPIVYDTKETPAEVLAQDKVIEAYTLPVAADRTRVIPVTSMFADVRL